MTLPAEEDLIDLPYFAILALGARCARVAEPLFGTWEGAPSEHVLALSQALHGVEDLARCRDAGARDPIWTRASDATRFAAEVASAADRASAPAAALRAADAAAELVDAIDPSLARRPAARAVSRSIRASAMAVQQAGSSEMQAFLEQLERDLQRLRQGASAEGWTDETGVELHVS